MKMVAYVRGGRRNVAAGACLVHSIRREGNAVRMDTYSLIAQAIRNREQVIATYDGYQRYMCPHILGVKAGRRQALFFQFAGGSKSGLPAGGAWRCIPVDALNDVRIQKGEWHTGTSAGGRMTCVDSIDVEVT